MVKTDVKLGTSTNVYGVYSFSSFCFILLFHDLIDRGDGETDDEEEELGPDPEPQKDTDEVNIAILDFLLFHPFSLS